MVMTDEQKYSAVLKELGEVLQSKNTTISIQRWQIDQLKEKLEAAEKELEQEKGYRATVAEACDAAEAECHSLRHKLETAEEAFAQLRTINIALRKCVDLKNGIILDAPALKELQTDIQEALQQAEGGAA